MKSHLIAALGLAALLAGPAYAADMPVLRKAPPMMVEDAWSGFYLGAVGGYGQGHSSHDGGNGLSSGSFAQKGWVAGGLAGYNWRLGSAIVGVELDISDADVQGSSAPGACINPCQTSVSWFYTGRARVGLPYGPVMPYVTGGAIVAGLKATEGFNPTAASPHVWGWVAGGGLEFMPLPQWSLRAEYLHAGISSAVETNDLFGAFATFPPITVKEPDMDIVRFGITYYLGADRGIVSSVSSRY